MLDLVAQAALDVCGAAIGVGIAADYAHLDVRGTWARWTYFTDKDADRRARNEIDAQ
ncbi:hypothetical protein AB0G67_46180 [Streptomyces sp. NPDC021056]|uniref:hypothetical protein n=1 Tax=Streptomyces sp. NPDC021056 TaxID=3155012 RepID=UPI0033E11C57